MASTLRAVARRLLRPILGEQRWQMLRDWEARRNMHPQLRREDARANRSASRDAPGLYVISEAGVRHFYECFLDWLAEHDPGLRARIWLDHLPGELPRHVRVMHAWVQDPVRERDPKVYRALCALEGRVRAQGGTVIQPARVLSHSLRVEVEQRLSDVGLRTPRTVMLRPAAADPFGGLRPPIVVRKEWGHIVPMRLCRTDDEAAQCVEDARRTGEATVASEFIETISPDGLYRKYRYLMTGACGQARHMIASQQWEVRPKDRVIAESLRAEELAYVNAPCALHEILDAARRRLEFDIAAFDYSFDTEGQPVVWEVNPFPDLSIPSAERAPHLKATGLATFELLAEYYRGMLRG
jgi:hypothetical protein